MLGMLPSGKGALVPKKGPKTALRSLCEKDTYGNKKVPNTDGFSGPNPGPKNAGLTYYTLIL